MEDVVFILQVKRSERGLESRPASSLLSPDALLEGRGGRGTEGGVGQRETQTERKTDGQ